MAPSSFEQRARTTSFLGLALLLLASNVSGQEKTLRWTPELSMRFHQVGSTAISPDGSRIAYAVREPLMEGPKSEYLSHIWIVDSEGTRAAQWTRGGRLCQRSTVLARWEMAHVHGVTLQRRYHAHKPGVGPPPFRRRGASGHRRRSLG